MENISVCRAAYLIPFIEILREIGAPVERELELGKLPVQVEETPNDFISNSLALKFLDRNEHREGIDDFGWLWSQRFSAVTFSSELGDALRHMPTVKAALDNLAMLIRLEDSDTRVGVINNNGKIEIFCDATLSEGMVGPISEWTQVMVLIEAVRSFTGSNWSPDEIRFKSDFDVCDAALQAYPRTRFIKKSNHTSIVVPTSVLVIRNPISAPASLPETALALPCAHDNVGYLKGLLRPYLHETAPKIDVLAEIAGTSRRTLQRKLKHEGVSYSQLIETTRFEMATEMLVNPDIQLVNVAMMLGYENQSNFGRSFRRISGLSPGKYRRTLLS